MEGGKEGRRERGGEFAGWAPASTSVPPRPCARRPPPAISIGLPGLHVRLHVAAAGSSSQQRWQPPRVSCFPARSMEEQAGGGRQPAGLHFKVSSPRCHRASGTSWPAPFHPGGQPWGPSRPPRSLAQAEPNPKGFAPGDCSDAPRAPLGEVWARPRGTVLCPASPHSETAQKVPALRCSRSWG